MDTPSPSTLFLGRIELFCAHAAYWMLRFWHSCSGVSEESVPNASQLEPPPPLASSHRPAQACRLTVLRGFLLARRPLGRLSNEALGVLVFVPTDRRRDSARIEVVRFADVLSNAVQLVDDGVTSFHCGLPAGSSSGVQMIGGVSPSERHMASIVPRIAAFAMCLQFHVKRYSIW